jgi:SAM-dependent methyltransferase
VSFDPKAHREASLAGWEAAASGWARRQEDIRSMSAPVSHWMVQAIDPQPGHKVLELASGMGETGMLAAELVQPGGGVIISDQAAAMLEGARARAAELGLENIEFKVLNAEWIDLPLASVDGVLCRWGYMLMADPATALADARRVLRPSGRIALAVWDEVRANPWAALPGLELRERGLGGSPEPAAPGPFTLGSRDRVAGLLEQAGFTEIDVDALDVPRSHHDFGELWELTLDMSPSFHDTVMERPDGEIEQIRASLAERFAPFTASDGSMRIPGRTLVASATA